MIRKRYDIKMWTRPEHNYLETKVKPINLPLHTTFEVLFGEVSTIFRFMASRF